MEPLSLAPPQAVIDVARRTMGAVDLVVGDSLAGRASEAARCLPPGEAWGPLHWPVVGKGRALLPIRSGGLRKARSLAGALLRSYRAGRVSEAVVWCGSSEILPSCPWFWDFPVCLPFRRLAAQYWDDELEELRRVAPSGWSAIVYLPPAAPQSEFARGLARFHVAAGAIGRVVLDERSGDSTWDQSYQALTGKEYPGE
jgi:hypothetical protein